MTVTILYRGNHAPRCFCAVQTGKLSQYASAEYRKSGFASISCLSTQSGLLKLVNQSNPGQNQLYVCSGTSCEMHEMQGKLSLQLLTCTVHSCGKICQHTNKVNDVSACKRL